MSDVLDKPKTVDRTKAPKLSPTRFVKPLVTVVAVVVLCALPLYVQAFWLQLGLFIFAAAVAALGLDLLTGLAGQLSLAHAFFVAVGAYGYTVLAGSDADGKTGLGLPPLLALVGAVLIAGLLGALFSPVAGRIRGLYLGVASLSLVYLGHHIMLNADSLTGGGTGRNVPDFSIFGFSFSNGDPYLAVFGVEFGKLERLWYLGLFVALCAWLFARHIRDGRPGRALRNLRDSETAAAVLGVDVGRYKAMAFTMSSMYAGLAGVLLALAYGRVVPDAFGLTLSVGYLAMIVIGGLGSVTGAVLGAVFVTALPQLLSKYADQLPFVGTDGGHSFGPNYLANVTYGIALIVVMLLGRGGFMALAGVFNVRKK